MEAPNGNLDEMMKRAEKAPKGNAGKVWLGMAIAGFIFGCLFGTNVVLIFTAICFIRFGVLALALAFDYGFAVLPGLMWWSGVFIVPMWIPALVRFLI